MKEIVVLGGGFAGVIAISSVGKMGYEIEDKEDGETEIRTRQKK